MPLQVDSRAQAPVRFIEASVGNKDQTVTQVVRDLMQRPAAIAPKYFYDALGSRLFDAITALPEYYPTRTEAKIFVEHRDAMAQAVHQRLGPAPTLVDLGAGSCEKAASLFDALKPSRYVAVDISADYLRAVLTRLKREHPAMDFIGVGTDFSAELKLPAGVLDGPSLLFYPGSSISNFSPPDASRFLREAHALAAGGALLIGVDLVKPKSLLEPAYDDALGVTALFNLNVLNHLNRLVGSNFDTRDWQHVAFYNSDASRIEMHLQAKREVSVVLPGQTRHFAAGERILTEHSYKWQPQTMEALLKASGFASVQTFTDDQQWFAVMLAHAQ